MPLTQGRHALAVLRRDDEVEGFGLQYFRRNPMPLLAFLHNAATKPDAILQLRTRNLPRLPWRIQSSGCSIWRPS